MISKVLVALTAVLMVAGCSNQSSKDYYAAIQTAAEANAKVQIAKFESLTAMADSDDAGTSAAAVMALALMEQPTIQPAYIESEALSYTKALAGPLAGITALWIQADLSRDLNDNNSKISIARINAESSDNRAMYSAFTEQSRSAGSATNNALSQSIDSTLQVALAGFETATAINGRSLDTVDGVTDTSFAALIEISNTGYATVESVIGIEHMTIDNLADHLSESGCCATCGTCVPDIEEPENPIEPDDCDDDLVISPGYCNDDLNFSP